jgi:hypothetical protein
MVSANMNPVTHRTGTRIGEPSAIPVRREWWSALGLALLGAVVAVSGMVYHGMGLFTERHLPLIRGLDDTYYFLWLPKLVVDHDLDFESALAQCPMITESDYQLEFTTPPTPTGMHYNKFPVGWALGSLPFYLVARAAALVFGLGDKGWEPVYQIAVWLGQFGYALAGLVCAWRIFCRWFRPAIAAAAVLAGWLASPLVYYQSAALSVTHSQVFALFAISSWLALKISDGDTNRWWFAALGLTAGLLVVTRYTAFAYLVLPAIVLSRYAAGGTSLGGRVWHLTVFVLGATPPILVQCAAWKILYGSWIWNSYGAETFDWAHPHVWKVLFSPLHGFFYWHPLMLIGIAGGAFWMWRRDPSKRAFLPNAVGQTRAPAVAEAMVGRLGAPGITKGPVVRLHRESNAPDFLVWAWGASFVFMLMLNACWPSWWFGVSFGNRAFEGTVLLAMGGLAYLFTTTKRPSWLRVLVYAAVGSGIAWNLMLFVLFLTRRIPGEAPVTWFDAWHAMAGMLFPA